MISLLAGLLCLGNSLPVTAQTRAWLPVRTGILYGISGIALVEGRDDLKIFLIVHDNKRDGEGRAALLMIQREVPKATYQPIAWEGETPIDLEGLTAVPGTDRTYMALSSAGKAFVIDLSENRAKVVVRTSFMVPDIPEGANFEGVAIQKVGDALLMGWGHRGENPKYAKLFLSRIEPSLAPPQSTSSADVPVPWPAAEGARGISDMKIDPNGTIFISSAADAGDDGPFQSALFTGGVCAVVGSEVTLRAGSTARLFWTDQHKIEAFDLLPGKTGGLIFGTDDENLGGCVWNNFWPE